MLASSPQPQVSELQVSEPQVSEPQVSEPQVSEPQVSEPQVSEPQVSEPKGKGKLWGVIALLLFLPIYGYFSKEAPKEDLVSQPSDTSNREVEISMLEEKNNLLYERSSGKIYTGIVKVYDSKGTVIEQASILNGQMSGELKSWGTSGSVILREQYKEGLRDGTCYSYHENGKVQVEACFKEGLREGVVNTYDEFGNLISLINYENGLLHGVSKTLKNKVVVRTDYFYKGKPVHPYSHSIDITPRAISA